MPSRWHGRVKALQGNAGIGKRTDRGHVGLLVVGMVCRLTSDIRFYSFGSNIGVGPIDSAMLATYSLFLAVMDGVINANEIHKSSTHMHSFPEDYSLPIYP